MRYVIFPYKMGSASSRLLARELGAIRVYENGRYRPRESDILINWGNPRQPAWSWNVPRHALNRPELARVASNKRDAVRTLQEAGIASVANFEPLRDNQGRYVGDAPIVARQLLNGHEGRGVTVVRPGDPLPPAPLYTKLIENHGEYRVHVFKGRVIDYAKKRRQRDNPPRTPLEEAVRSFSNGWVFTRGNLRRLERIENLAIQAVATLGLDFGGVDIIKDENRNVHVLEVNTAVGLRGPTTLEAYVNAIREYATTH